MNIDHKKPKTSYIQKEEEPIRKKGMKELEKFMNGIYQDHYILLYKIN